MSLQGFWLILVAIVAGTLSLIVAILVIRWWDNRRRNRLGTNRANRLEGELRPMVFLFRGDRLIDATSPARSLLDRTGASGSDWARLMRWAAPRFLNAEEKLQQIARFGRVELKGDTGMGSASLRLVAESVDDGLVRISITDPQVDGSGIIVDSMSQQAMEEELDLLRRALDQTPMLVWRQDQDKRVTWANAAYLRQAETQMKSPVSWPLPKLMEAPATVPGGGTSPARRASLEDNGVVSWYDCHTHKVGDETTMLFAVPADAAVRAERSLREFVQTLTKTFADLPIGLAIFDRERHLQLFNPSLIDLTGLSAGFLTARPTLFDFLDKLRELRMVPEPKNYRNWRQQMANLETAATTGRHVETWSLPGGQTYRVTGRPHPDGALAFLFEDITSEISLTRKFRAELSLGTNVLDGIEDALVVFAPGDQVIMTNQAYRDLWGETTSSMSASLGAWQQQIESGPGFTALQERLTASPDGAVRDSGVMFGPDRQLLQWSVSPLGVGRQMVRFRSSDLPIQADDPLEIEALAAVVRAG